MGLHYYAIRPTAVPDNIRIEKAATPEDAQREAFGRPTFKRKGIWQWKDLGTRVSIMQSDKKRIALLKDPDDWHDLYEGQKQ